MECSEDYKKLEQTNPSLLRKIKDRRNTDAWREFDALYRPILRRYAKAKGLSDADVEDVVQHCMTSISMHIEQFQYDPSRGRFKGWLRTMVNNRCRDLIRARRVPSAEVEELDQLADQEDSPKDAFDKIWVDEHLAHCLCRMSEEVDQQSFLAFQRHVVNGQSVEEVCEAMSLTPDKLYKIKWRLTKRLREYMKVFVGDDYDGWK